MDWRRTEASGPVVVAVVWTYNRFAVVSDCIAALRAQTLVLDRIIVADSASPDDSASQLRDMLPAGDVVELLENDGMGAAIAAALRAARARPYDYLWFVEDDSSPSSSALAELVGFLEGDDRYSVVGNRGAVLRHGLWYWTDRNAEGPCDFCMLDGSLIRRAVIDVAGVPREDFFIMQVDVEYPMRVRRSGHLAYQLGHVQHGALQLGSAAPGSGWRAYYQTRNHLRMAIDFRSGWLLWGFVVRSGAQLVTEARRGRPGLRLSKARLRGVFDALRGRMGRTVDPSPD